MKSGICWPRSVDGHRRDRGRPDTTTIRCLHREPPRTLADCPRPETSQLKKTRPVKWRRVFPDRTSLTHSGVSFAAVTFRTGPRFGVGGELGNPSPARAGCGGGRLRLGSIHRLRSRPPRNGGVPRRGGGGSASETSSGQTSASSGWRAASSQKKLHHARRRSCFPRPAKAVGSRARTASKRRVASASSVGMRSECEGLSWPSAVGIGVVGLGGGFSRRRSCDPVVSTACRRPTHVAPGPWPNAAGARWTRSWTRPGGRTH